MPDILIWEQQNLILAQQLAVDYAFRKGADIVTSAGNQGSNYDGNAFMNFYNSPLES